MFIRIIICIVSLLVCEQAYPEEQTGPLGFGSAKIEIAAGGKLVIEAMPGFHSLMLSYLLFNMFKRSLMLCVQDCKKHGVNPKVYFDFSMDEGFKECIQEFIDSEFDLEIVSGEDKGFEFGSEIDPMDLTMTHGGIGSCFTVEQELSRPD